jgi:NADH:ubiquinone oxidoreductase subunit F (NADH-binding)
MRVRSRADLAKLGKTGTQMLFPARPRITVGLSTCGIAKGAGATFDALRKELRRQKYAATLEAVGCTGLCNCEPIVTLQMPGLPLLTLGDVTAADVPELVRGLQSNRIPAGKILYTTAILENINTANSHACAAAGNKARTAIAPAGTSLPFLKKQKRIVLRNCGITAPVSLAQYCARGGFAAAYTAIATMRPGKIIAEVQRSGLRGRGGAGFSTGEKWAAVAAAAGRKKFFICNGDEGDPGAYMDRSILEGDPFSVLEGMLIGACAVGATRGFVYVRGEYPLAVQQVTAAIAEMKKTGLLGKNIFGTSFSFTIDVERGAGAFVCGEETALIASLEGKAGEPVGRPPYPAEKGYLGMPTCINNVETLANIPVIIARGGEWYSRIGKGKSRGTKVFSIVGAVKRVGLIEVPMGMPLKTIIDDIGGGIAAGRKLKAVQTGGPSGGCIPARLANLGADYESLIAAGSIMGSGGMIVMDDRTCMVDVAKYFMGFLKDESCGKCLPCRQGTQAIHDILERITTGRGRLNDLSRMQEIAAAMAQASLCGLGKTAANPVLSTMRYFAKEYEAHIKSKRCPAGVCTALIRFSINRGKCIGCGACRKACPVSAVSGSLKKKHIISSKLCIRCRACFEVCPAGAVEIR